MSRRTRCKPRRIKHLQRQQQGQDKLGPSPCFPTMRGQDPQGGSRRRCWSWETIPFHPHRASYLWVWPHLRVVVKAINEECDHDTCGTVRRQKTNYASGPEPWSLNQKEHACLSCLNPRSHHFVQDDFTTGRQCWHGKAPEQR